MKISNLLKKHIKQQNKNYKIAKVYSDCESCEWENNHKEPTGQHSCGKKYKQLREETLEEFNSHFNCKGFPFEFDEDGYLIVENGNVMGNKVYKTATINDIKEYIRWLIPDKFDNDTSTFSNRNFNYVDGFNKCVDIINKKLNN